MEKTFIDERMVAMPTVAIVKLEKEADFLQAYSLEIVELALQDLCGDAGKNYTGIKEAKDSCAIRIKKAEDFSEKLLQVEFIDEKFVYRVKKVEDKLNNCKEFLLFIPLIFQQILFLQQAGKEFPVSLGVEFSVFCEKIKNGIETEKEMNEFLQEKTILYAKEESLAVAFVYAFSVLQDMQQIIKSQKKC